MESKRKEEKKGESDNLVTRKHKARARARRHGVAGPAGGRVARGSGRHLEERALAGGDGVERVERNAGERRERERPADGDRPARVLVALPLEVLVARYGRHEDNLRGPVMASCIVRAQRRAVWRRMKIARKIKQRAASREVRSKEEDDAKSRD